MALAIAVTLAQKHFYGIGYAIIAAGAIIGSTVGWVGARKVKMTAMPQMWRSSTASAAARCPGRTGRVPREGRRSRSHNPQRVGRDHHLGADRKHLLRRQHDRFGKLQGLVGDRPIVWRGQRSATSSSS